LRSIVRRPLDLAFVVFFLVNLLVITYQVDLEQLVIADPTHFTYPVWPPPFSVDAVHSWGRNFDPVLLARPVWWKVTIWIDVLLYGPFYVAAIYALVQDRPWITTPMVLWAGLMLMGVAVIMGEEMFAPYPTPQPVIVWLANTPWIIFPLLAVWRALAVAVPRQA
jgi:hypothetical protein